MARLRIWWNWQTRYFEVVVPQGVQVQVLLCAPTFFPADGRPHPLNTNFSENLGSWLTIFRNGLLIKTLTAEMP